jgi:uncharacterized DUF497 family protein
MRVEWDERKAEANAKKHGVTFEEAVTALMDVHAITFVDETVSHEERDITVGHSVRNRLLLVVHTERESGALRVVSARRATPKERKVYEEGI